MRTFVWGIGRAATIWPKRRAAGSTLCCSRYPRARANASSRSPGAAACAASSSSTARAVSPRRQKRLGEQPAAPGVLAFSASGRRIVTACAASPICRCARARAWSASRFSTAEVDALRNASRASAAARRSSRASPPAASPRAGRCGSGSRRSGPRRRASCFRRARWPDRRRRRVRARGQGRPGKEETSEKEACDSGHSHSTRHRGFDLTPGERGALAAHSGFFAGTVYVSFLVGESLDEVGLAPVVCQRVVRIGDTELMSATSSVYNRRQVVRRMVESRDLTLRP